MSFSLSAFDEMLAKGLWRYSLDENENPAFKMAEIFSGESVHPVMGVSIVCSENVERKEDYVNKFSYRINGKR